MSAYSKEIYDPEQFYTDTKRLRVILDAKYEKENLHMVMEN